MTYQHDQNQRPGLFALVLFLMIRLLITIWLLRAIFFYLWPGYRPGLGFDTFARIYLSFRDSLYTLDHFLASVLQLFLNGVQWVYGELRSELGYDPLPRFELAWLEIEPRSWDGISLTLPAGLDSIALDALQTMSLVQLSAMVGLMIFGAKLEWSWPGIPKFYNLPKIIYWLVNAGTCVWLSREGFSFEWIDGVVTTVVTLAVWWLPLAAGLPLFVLNGLFGLHPRMPFVWVLSFVRFLAQGGLHQAPQNNMTIQRAYAVLGLNKDASADEFVQASHKSVQKAHPSRGGSADALTEVYKAREALAKKFGR